MQQYLDPTRAPSLLLYTGKMKKRQGIVRQRKGAFIDDEKSKIATRVEQKVRTYVI